MIGELPQTVKAEVPKVVKRAWHVPKPDWARVRRFFSRETVLSLQDEGRVVLSMLAFFGLLLLFLLEILLSSLARLKFWQKTNKGEGEMWGGRVGKWLERIADKLEPKRGGVRRSFLISMAFRNMRSKRTRSFVTVGGMSVGIGAIVFLVSLGYGLQNLVVSRVARLEELKMADVTLGSAGAVKINREAVETMQAVPGVREVMPVVSLVGKVQFGGGVGETVVYGVSKEFLEASGLHKIAGEYFPTKQAGAPSEGRVAGASTAWQFREATLGARIRSVTFNIEPEQYLRVRESASPSAAILGYVKRVEGGYEGVEYWGGEYEGDPRGREGEGSDGTSYGRWIKAPYPIWQKKGTEYTPDYDSERVQNWREGYVAEVGVVVDEDATSYTKWDDDTDYQVGEVLGESTVATPAAIVSEGVVESASISAVVVGKDEQGIEWVSLDSEASGSAKTPEVLMIEMPEGTGRAAVVNKPFLSLLGITPDKAVGTTFDVGFVILNTLKPELDRPAESKPVTYTVAAVVDEGTTPVIYTPLTDIEALGITNYSQAKLVAENKEVLPKVRQQVETMGYQTSSVADTVSQINSLFGTVRIVLATFGLVALSVASLGMFNTLTVSLMERTREVGVMKAMGMQGSEVKELFLAEAMVMGLLGGVFGVLIGYLAGYVAEVAVSAFAIAKGVGWIDLAYVPPLFVVFVLVLSFVVGVVTGIYPARRATRISALDALRYE